MDDQQLQNAFNAFQKLRPRLRAVPAHWDDEYGFIPVPTEMNHIKNLPKFFRTNPEEEKYSYRRDPCGGPIILWEPNDDKYPKPTFIQFLRAFYRNAAQTF